MSYSQRLQKIQFQLLQNLTFEPSDAQRVAMVQSIITATMRQAEVKGEDLAAEVASGNMPTTVLGVAVSWDESNPEGDSFTLNYEGISVTQDADDSFEHLVNTQDGINDFEAVKLDAAALTVGLGSNTNLRNVDSALTFPSTGENGTTITWDTSGHPGVDNSGAISQDENDVTGPVVATISKGSESENKTFNITVLQLASQPVGADFVTTWKTDNTGNVTSNSDQVKLPLDSEGTYNFTVQWGDGQSDTITTHDQAEVTHTYPSAGTYDITISGTCEGFGMNSTGEDNSKLIDVKSWGNVILKNGNQFRMCDNLTGFTATDAPDLSSVSSLAFMFLSAANFNGDISHWDTSNVTSMEGMFASSGFNQDISTWDVSSVTNMSNMFHGADRFNHNLGEWDISSVEYMDNMFLNCWLSAENYDALLNGWVSLGAGETQIPTGINFHAGSSQYTEASSAAHLTLENTYGWNITDAGQRLDGPPSGGIIM